MPHVYTPELVEKMTSIVKEASSLTQANRLLSQAMGLSLRQAQRLSRRFSLWRPGFSKTPKTANAKWSETDTEAEATFSTDRPSSLEEVLEHVDFDRKVWRVKMFSVGGPNKAGEYNWRLSFERLSKDLAIDADKLLASFVDAAKANRKPVSFPIAKPSKDKGLLVINSHDAHLGKLCWRLETLWADYDSNITKRLYRESLNELLSKAPMDKIDTILLVVGSDLLHYDSTRTETTRGTRQDADTRWAKMYDEACRLLSEVIEELAVSGYKIEVMVVNGNHASLSEYCLGSYLVAWFHDYPNVTVHNRPSKRKYYGYGKTLFGFVHDAGNLKDIPMVMVRENQSTISNYKHFEILSGDKHHERMIDEQGFKVRIAPALCPPDAWHSENNYVGSVRQSQALYYSKENGLEAIYYSKPLD